MAGNVSVPIQSNFIVGRADYNLTSKWNTFAYYLWEGIKQNTTDQIEFNPPVTNGKYLISVSQLPVKPTVS